MESPTYVIPKPITLPRQMRHWDKRLICGTCNRRFMTTMSLFAHWDADHKNES